MIEGDGELLRNIAKAIGSLGLKSTMGDISRAMSEELLYQIHWGFDHETDPYGEPWEPLKYRKGKILRKSGRLANSWHRTSDSSGFAAYTNVIYASVHQEGAEIKRSAGVNVKGGRNSKANTEEFIELKTGHYGPLKRRRKKSVRITFHSAFDATLPQRMMVPDGELPEKWFAALNREGMIVIERKLAILAS